MDEKRRHDRLQEVAEKQWGVIRIDQVRAAGFSADERFGLLAEGILRHRFRGIYSYGTDRPLPKGVLLAAQWSVGRDAFLTGRTALGLAGVRGIYLGEIDVAVPRRTVRPRTRPIRLSRGASPPTDLRVDGPLRYAPVERALIDLAATGAGEAELRRLITDAIHLKRLNHERMRVEISSHTRRLGNRSLRSAYAAYLPDAEGKSGLERSVARALTQRPWLPESIPNHHLEAAGVTWEIDRYFPEERVAVELHGGGYHHAEADVEKDSFKAVKLALVGIQTIVITDTRWELEPESCLDDLEAMLAQRGWRRAA